MVEARIATLDERIRTVEKFLSREEFAELTEVARTLVADIREFSEASQELHSEMGETEQRFSETGQRLSEAYEFASNQINRLEAEEGWIQTLDLMCQHNFRPGRERLHELKLYGIGEGASTRSQVFGRAVMTTSISLN